jgi:hypothetical protein
VQQLANIFALLPQFRPLPISLSHTEIDGGNPYSRHLFEKGISLSPRIRFAKKPATEPTNSCPDNFVAKSVNRRDE